MHWLYLISLNVGLQMVNKTETFSDDKKNQLDITLCSTLFLFINCSACFGQFHAHHQELTTEWCDRRVWYSAVTIGCVKLGHVYCVWNDMFVCFRGFSKSSVTLPHARTKQQSKLPRPSNHQKHPTPGDWYIPETHNHRHHHQLRVQPSTRA